MDLRKLVQAKLFGPGEKCIASVIGSLQHNGQQLQRIAALVEGQGEYGLFLYKCEQIIEHNQNPEYLHVDKALAVNNTFRFDIVPNASHSKDCAAVRFSNDKDTIVVELNKTQESGTFFNEIKKAKQVKENNQSLGIVGLPSTFSWMEKYTDTGQRDTPFISDPFDPLAPRQDPDGWPYSHIINPGAADCPVVEDTLTSSELNNPTSGFEDNFVPNSKSAPEGWAPLNANSLTEKTKRVSLLDEPGANEVHYAEEAVEDSIEDTGREFLIQQIMKTREDEYTELVPYRFFCGTWNVNGQAANEFTGPWLAPEGEIPPDIYAVGFQELDLSKNAYIFTESAKEEEWYNKVKEGLHPKAQYQTVKLVRLVGMMLIVFVRRELVKYIKDVQSETVGTGIMGMMGNKGGVGVRFSFHDTAICFVNSHLAAHTEEYERRNQDFRDINSRMNFGGRNSISEHDLVFWVGDLNYRLSDIDRDRVIAAIDTNNLSSLMPHDQLHRQMDMRKVYLDYQEGEIKFIPTYRYDAGTDRWDSSEKCRCPAWCDRILWRGPNIKQLVYTSCPSLKLSDHKPVLGVFNVGTRKRNSGAYKKVYEDAMKQLDKKENDVLPQVKLDQVEINFDKVKFIEPQSRVIEITNTGQVPVQYEFINKPGDTSPCKSWLTIEPPRGTIKVGEFIQVQIEVYVSKVNAPQLNSGDDLMEDILVLHLQRGKDFFITVMGNYLPSVFGSSIEALTHMYGPIRDVETATLISLEHTGSTPASPERPLDIPKEVYRLVDHLYKQGLNTDSLFQLPGSHSEIQLIRDSLDTGTPSEIPGSIHSVAEALLELLASFSEPVIPYAFYDKCINCCSQPLLCRQVVSQFPLSHRNLFEYICAFLKKCMEFSQQNNLEAKDLAQIFQGILFRQSEERKASVGNRARNMIREEERKKAAFIYNFLT